ncbi:hypothetical protein SAMD00019534_062390 [Acytostelium subglobosum LB1]|uniref:hypothetical protein n=1 Tax=Acytostelium subglobosum LB1 TaxID=1410327 RepID=UPI0006448B2B|nr:hypothetical protein SAMD00019534_062390 [Acytostelium subglobosum LB1]GAM23064.1 hypothetical protein SAMD00019534_062390 [Acytostelium subglobosum LB1]|eukprot:XP_012754291.1 hypothetical protein SAMD00019534_062390 [Acytostelium subglobosum LB1]
MLPHISIDLMLNNMKMLLDAKQYESAETLGNFIISTPSLVKGAAAGSAVTNQMILALTMFADAMFNQGQHLRACKYYKAAFEMLAKLISPSSHTSLFSQAASKQPQITASLRATEYELRYKMALCHVQTKRIPLAISHLEIIPIANRTLAIHLTLAKLYRETMREKTKDTITCYKEALRLCPLCIEAINALKELGEDPEAILQPVLNKQNFPNTNIDSSWIPALAQSTIELKRNQPQKSLFILKKLEAKFTGNLYLLERLAMAYLYNDEPSIVNTTDTFKKIRTIDPLYVGSMDVYCSILKRRQLPVELNKVCSELVNAYPQSPESWTSAAMYYYLKETNEKAVECVERALSIDESHTQAHSLKGEIYLSIDEPRIALPSLERAFALSKNILTARDLVRCHLFLNQLNEALAVAKAIHRLSPDYSKSKALVGMVLANQPEERDQARKILQEALVLSPFCIDSVLTMSKLNLVEGKAQDAIDLIQRQLDNQETDLMHTEMANIYMEMGSEDVYDKAIHHFNQALEINGSYEGALTGLHRLELLRKGLDPDQIDEGIDGEDLELQEDDELDDEENLVDDMDDMA